MIIRLSELFGVFGKNLSFVSDVKSRISGSEVSVIPLGMLKAGDGLPTGSFEVKWKLLTEENVCNRNNCSMAMCRMSTC